MSYKPKHYGDAELHGQRQFCTDSILKTADNLRDIRGSAILVSPVDGAVGRFGAPSSRSQHSVDYWGFCNALDLFCTGLDPNDPQQWKELYRQCREAGATGIGFYPEAQLGRHRGMVHIDCREGFGQWSAWRKNIGRGWKYLGIDQVTQPVPGSIFDRRMSIDFGQRPS